MNQRSSGQAMAMIGFAMILVNAYGYLFDGFMKHPAYTILGLIFMVIGLKMARKNNK